MFAVQILQSLARHMRIDLGRREITVTQQQLHNPKIGAPIEQVSRECMPQAVRRHFFADSGFFSVTLDDVPKRLPRHAIAATRREKVIRLALEQYLHARSIDKICEPALRLVAKWYQALAVAFTDNAQYALVKLTWDCVRLMSSETRKPVAYNSSSIARSR